MTPLVVPPNRARFWRLGVSSLVFAAFGVWLVVRALLVEDRAFGAWSAVVAGIGVASIVFFGLCGAWFFVRLASPTPLLVIDDRGLVDSASAVGVGFVAWSEIEELRQYRFGRQTFLGVVPRDHAAILQRQRLWKRWIMRLNRRFGALPINVPASALPMPVSDLLEELQGRLASARQGN